MGGPLESLTEGMRNWGVFIAGALFGLGWWCWVDAVAVSLATASATFSWVYVVPGSVATLGMLVIGAAARGTDQGGYLELDDEGAQCRSRCVLFLGYVMAFSSIGAAIIFLVEDRQRGADLWIGASSVVQAFLLSASGLVLWLSKAEEGYM